MTSRVFSIPGFLGQPSDWTEVLPPQTNFTHIPCAYDHSFVEDMSEWGGKFNQEIGKNYGLPVPHRKHVLMGYSLGGRLALHVLEQNITQWDAAVIISTNPGLGHCANRIENDGIWAEKFRTQSWDLLMSAWNAQKVFSGGSATLPRKEQDYDRTQLADILTYWSVGKQKDFKPFLSEISIPILWCVGANDQAYVSQAQNYKFKHPLSRIVIVENAGHRLPWDQKESFTQELELFIQSL